jgi:hypothetical protein
MSSALLILRVFPFEQTHLDNAQITSPPPLSSRGSRRLNDALTNGEAPHVKMGCAGIDNPKVESTEHQGSD